MYWFYNDVFWFVGNVLYSKNAQVFEISIISDRKEILVAQLLVVLESFKKNKKSDNWYVKSIFKNVGFLWLNNY